MAKFLKFTQFSQVPKGAPSWAIADENVFVQPFWAKFTKSTESGSKLANLGLPTLNLVCSPEASRRL